MSDQRVRVLYLAGSGRSGTTFISHILDQLDDVFAGGELRFVWERGVIEDHLCGCGRPFSGCPFWTAVMAEVYRSGPDSGLADANALRRGLSRRLRIRRVPAVLARRLMKRPPVPEHHDDEVIRRLYDAVAKVSGARIIVDSSKLPSYGLLLSQQPNVDMSVLHVIRDSRATAFSWQRTKESLDRGDSGELMPRFEIWKSSLLWLWWNFVTVSVWGSDSGRYLRVGYEDFSESAQATMSDIARFIGADPASLPFESPTAVRLDAAHFVAGNPNRHTKGTVQILPDREWERALSTKDLFLVTGLTLPGLVRFGYSLRRRRLQKASTHEARTTL